MMYVQCDTKKQGENHSMPVILARQAKMPYLDTNVLRQSVCKGLKSNLCIKTTKIHF